MVGKFLCALLPLSLTLAACQTAPAPSPTVVVLDQQPVKLSFYKTQDSNDWVRHSLMVQQKYSRVLLVTTQPAPAKTLGIAPLDLNARPGSAPGAVVEYPVEKVFATLQAAADESRGGDLIAVALGTYAGFIIDGARPGAGDNNYIHFKALGDPGDVIINDPPAGRLRAWMIFLTATHHIIIDGFNLDGSGFVASRPPPRTRGRPVSRPATRAAQPTTRVAMDQPVFGNGRSDDTAGIMLGSGFDRHGTLTHHIIVMNNFSHHHAKWGLHSTDTYTCLLQDNLFAFSSDEHGCYVSDGSDDYVIRRNIFTSNSGGGLQCNLDAETSLRVTARNKAFADFPKMAKPVDDWARKLVARATELFGENGFPDGRGVNFIIEENVSTQNGKSGGGAFNLSGLQDSLVQNNLVYNNLAHGIAIFDQGGTFDTVMIQKPPFTSPSQITGPDVLPLYGSHTNLVRNNTVMMNDQGRGGILLLGGSYGCVLRNNLVLNEADDAIHIDSLSLWHFDSGYNAINQEGFSLTMPSGYWTTGKADPIIPMPAEFKTLATNLDAGNHSELGVTSEQLKNQLVRSSNEPWVIFENHWWKLNPNRPDFHPRGDSSLLVNKAEKENMPPLDNEGNQRKSADIGAYGAAR